MGNMENLIASTQMTGRHFHENAPDMQLVQVSIVNWYAFAKVDLPILGNTCFMGNNGAGKSSVIDAVQLVMTGGNKRKFKANASADQTSGSGKEKERRNVFDYCLGNVDGQILRNVSVTYLALVFRSIKTGESYSMGLAMSAREEDGRENMMGSFVIAGTVSTDDFLIDEDNQLGTRTWDEFTRHVTEKFKSKHTRTYSGARKGDFLETAFKAIARAEIDFDAYLDSVRKALSFSSMEDPTDFVRTFVLPKSHLVEDKIELSRDSYRTYKEIEAKIDLLKHEAQVLTDLQAKAQSLKGRKDELDGLRWAKLSVRLDNRLEEARRLNSIVAGHTADIKAKKEERSNLRTSLEAMTIALIEAERSAGERDVTRRLEDISDEIERLQRKEKREEGEIDTIISRVESMSKLIPLIDDASLVKKSNVAFTNSIEEFKALAKDRSITQERIDKEKQMLGLIRDSVSEQERSLIIQIEAVRGDIARDLPFLEEANSTGRMLSPQVVKLQRELAQLGIDSKPLCSLAFVADKQWGLAVETLLGRTREAIIVHPEDVSRTIELLKAKRKEYEYCEVFNAKHNAHLRPAVHGSLASVVRFHDDPLAQYAKDLIYRRIADVVMVDDEQDLKDHHRAVTRSAMVIGGGTFGYRKRPHVLLMGEAGSAHGIDEIRERVARNDDKLRALETNYAKVSEILGATREALMHISASSGLGDSRAQLIKTQKELKKQRELQSVIMRSVDSSVLERIETLKEEKQSSERRLDSVDIEISRLERVSAEEASRFVIANTEAQDIEEEMELSSNTNIQTIGRNYLANFSGSTSEIEASIKSTENSIRTIENNWIRDVATYMSEFSVAKPESVDPDSILSWISDRRREILERRILQYEDEARESKKTVTSLVINDLLVSIGSDMRMGKRRLDEINRILETKFFGSEYYQFTWQPNPEFSDLLRLSDESMRMERDLEALLDRSDDGDEAFSNDPSIRGLRRLRSMFESDNDELTVLSDYRNFMVFDLKALDRETHKVVSDFSKLQKRSGGERQIPFYVAIGTAITSATRGSSDKDGFCLGMFDEAFSALDTRNTGVSLDLLSDMGMQWIVSAPTDKRVPLARAAHTLVNITRVGVDVQLDIEYPTIEAQMAYDKEAEVTIAAELAAELASDEAE